MSILKSIASFLLFTLLIQPARAQNRVERWDFIELTYRGSQSGNPFTDVQLQAQFTHPEKTVTVDGFYDGNGVYKIRFMPDRLGRWTFTTKSNARGLNGKKGNFECVAPSPTNHGPVVVANQYHFAYADTSPYVPVGTTCYAWIHQDVKQQEQTLQTLKGSPFNKMRMTVFPKYYAYNRREPALYPYEKNPDGGWDYTRFNPAFFQALDKRINDLRSLNIEADLILFHPYDEGHWGFDRMTTEANHRYLNYLLARVSAYRNVWWSVANEYDLDRNKTMADWEGFFGLIVNKDPYQHLRSIHNGDIDALYDYSKPHITHVSIQHPNLKDAPQWRKFGKPVINDECEYEGDILMPWGNISGRELVHRAWLGYGYGIYVGHGETFDDPSELLWWSHGGELKGESPARLDFLRKIMLETSPRGLTPLTEDSWMWTRFPAGKADGVLMYYFAEHQPSRWWMRHTEEGKEYTVEVIDPWEMTVTPLEGKYKKGQELKLPATPYLALRIREVR
jgi:hypothetical protein